MSDKGWPEIVQKLSSPHPTSAEYGVTSTQVASTLTPGSKVMYLEYAGTKGETKQATSNSNKMPSANEKSPAKESKKGVDGKQSTTKTKAKDDTNKTPAAAAAPAKAPLSKKAKPTMVQMAHEAIVSLGDRTGSSQIAITKWLIAEKQMEDDRTFRSRLNLALKSAVQQERFKKVRNSYKIDAAFAKKEREKKKKHSQKKNDVDKKKTDEKKRQEAAQKLKALEAAMTSEQLEAHRRKHADKRALELKKEEAAQLAKERAERLKKRRFPMEDTKLHAEDKELGVKPPADVTRRPALPYIFCETLVGQKQSGGKTPSTVLSASKCDNLEYGSQGLVPDLLSVYHFFRGDVHYCPSDDEPLVPDFSLQHLMYAVAEVLNGNAKRSRMLPPLLVHLFVTSLKLLTSPPVTEGETPHERRLREDLTSLQAGLSPLSWGEVCFLYMDTLERYYTSNASLDPNVLPSGNIDVPYLMRVTNVAEPMTPAVFTKGDDDAAPVVVLPDGYCGYLGNPHSALSRAYAKLLKQDPWNLTAEELLALLRALTDDVLATRPEIGEDIARRDGQMYALLKAKRAADTQFRKVRLGYEGPKQPSKKRKDNAEETDVSKEEETKENKADTMEEDPKSESVPTFRPTSTKKQFEKAAKDQQKAHDAYEKGLRKLMARTEPVGYDRNHNAIYCFNHDPEMLYVEVNKPPSVKSDRLPADMLMKRYFWHVIDTKSLFDEFASSLDIRGTREHELYDSLLGPEGGHYSLKRGLFDDLKERRDKAAREREREDLERRLANATNACQEEEEGGGRRSGRLQSRAQIDLAQIEEEILDLDKREASVSVPTAPDYDELTGLDLLRKFDAAGRRRETRRSRERKSASTIASKDLPDMPCTQLIPSGNIDGSGVVGWIVSEMLKIEETCNELCPWERTDISRDRWIADLEDRVNAWNSSSLLVIGPPQRTQDADDVSESGSSSLGTPASKAKRISIGNVDSSDSKRRRVESGSPASTSSCPHALSIPEILAMLKTPLLDLEQRVFEFTGLSVTTQDADEAEDNMSATSEDERSRQEQKEKLAWKKKIHCLRNIDTKRSGQIREVVVEAITAARKAHLHGVVVKLRSALLLHRPMAAGECKSAALAVLDSHGGDYQEDSDSDESDVDTVEEESAPSLLPLEAMMITGSLAGDDNADRVDWIDGVNSCKTLSRLAALSFAFIHNATKLLEKIGDEGDTLWELVKVWEKEEERRARARNGKTKAPSKIKDEVSAPTEVWADVRYTNEFCMAKLEGYPYWPAKKCEARDEELKSSLLKSGRTLVALVGEGGGLRVVRLEDIRPFTGEQIDKEAVDEQPKNIRSQLDECMVMARRIVRGRKKSVGKVGQPSFLEEKKTAM